jgi:hypothetical protein
MKKPLSLLCLIFFFFTFVTSSIAQTAGSATVYTIEQKANSLVNLETKIADLKTTRLGTYSLEAEKLKKLRLELSALRTEMDQVLDELRRGRFCKGCNSTASQLRNRGIYNVEQHFADNGGTYPASPELIRKTTEEYNRKIEAKEAELKAFEFSENEFTRKRADLDRQISDLTNNIDRLRQEITALSKTFKEQVLKEAKAMHLNWIGDVLHTLADKHYAEDRINIINVKLGDLDKEEAKNLAELKEKINKKIEADKKDLANKIEANRLKMIRLNQANTEKLSSLNTALNSFKSRLITVNASLQKSNLTEAEKLQLTTEKANLEDKITTYTKDISLEESNYKTAIIAIQQESKAHSDKIFELNSSVAKIQADALANLKNAFATKRKIIQDAKVARTASLENFGRLLSEKRGAYTKKNNAYLTELDAERIRVMNACTKAKASCYATETNLEVAGNWNRSLGCVGELENFHYSNDPIYGCVEESPLYRQYYQSLLGSLSDSEMEALQRTNSRTRYDMIFKKVIN